MLADAGSLSLDSVCEEHTWSFAEGGHDLGSSNVQLRNANCLSVLSDRKVVVSYDVLCPGGRVVLHAQIPFVQSDVRRPLLIVGKLTKMAQRSHRATPSGAVDSCFFSNGLPECSHNCTVRSAACASTTLTVLVAVDRDTDLCCGPLLPGCK